MAQKKKTRCISHKIALLGGEDWRDEKMRRFTKYAADGETILLSYATLNHHEVGSLEERTGAIVIIPRKWGWNMSKRWEEVREKVLWQVANTTIYIVRLHYPQAYNIQAQIKPIRLDNEGAINKNLGLPFRTIGEAANFCLRNNIKIIE